MVIPPDAECVFTNGGVRGASSSNPDSFLLYDVRNTLTYIVWKEANNVAAGTYNFGTFTCYPKAVGNIEFKPYLW
jgi:hypothetical protein